MLEKLFALFGDNVHRISMVISIGSNIMKAFDTEFAADKNAKNAAIDTLIEILAKHKDLT